MVGIWKKLFGSTQVIDAGIAAGDALFFTNEEKAEWKLRLLKAYEPFKIAQRWLALLMTTPFMLLHIVAGLQLAIVGWLEPVLGKRVDEAARVLIEMNNDALAYPVGVILTFYFGCGAAEGIIRQIQEKKQKDT
jgi:hypothetical protein